MLLRVLIFAVCGMLILASASMLGKGSPPTEIVPGFLSKLKSNDAHIADLFGDNTCKCPPRGGYQTYLKYDAGQEPNLAFLVGHPFEFAIGKTTLLDNNIEYVFPWDKPETTYVDVQLNFPKDQYQPLFLPKQLAFGIPMKESEFNQFLNDPNIEGWKGFTERLRPTVKPGVISQAPTDKIRSQKELENLLSPEMLAFLKPTDAGHVIVNGTPMTDRDLEAKLPRLVSATLRLKVVRSGQLKPWVVNKFRFENAIVTTGEKPVTIEFPLNSKIEL